MFHVFFFLRFMFFLVVILFIKTIPPPLQEQNTAVLSHCEASERFCGLQNLTQPFIGMNAGIFMSNWLL